MTNQFVGIDVGTGTVKCVLLQNDGTETSVTIPSLIALAEPETGEQQEVSVVEINGQRYWVGEEALLAPYYQPATSKRHLEDPVFLPALVKRALRELGAAYAQNSNALSVVSGLSKIWLDKEKYERTLASLISCAWENKEVQVQMVTETLGLAFSVLLDQAGTRNQEMMSKGIAFLDLGYYTVDLCTANKGHIPPDSFFTWFSGSKHPLNRIRNHLSALIERDISLCATDQAVQQGYFTAVDGTTIPLPDGWDQPLLKHGTHIAYFLQEVLDSGTQFDVILVGGGGANQERLTDPLRKRFPHLHILEEPQHALARGFARYARFLMNSS